MSYIYLPSSWTSLKNCSLDVKHQSINQSNPPDHLSWLVNIFHIHVYTRDIPILQHFYLSLKGNLHIYLTVVLPSCHILNSVIYFTNMLSAINRFVFKHYIETYKCLFWNIWFLKCFYNIKQDMLGKILKYTILTYRWYQTYTN